MRVTALRKETNCEKIAALFLFYHCSNEQGTHEKGPARQCLRTLLIVTFRTIGLPESSFTPNIVKVKEGKTPTRTS